MKKRFISIVIVFVLVFALIPLTTSAANLSAQADVEVGSIIEFGGYSWRVLDVRDGRALIITEYVLGHGHYHHTFERVTWATSDVRKWLNNDFLARFLESERNKIAETIVINNDNPWFGTSGGADTVDRVFLLSIEEVVKFFGDSGQLVSSPDGLWAISDQYNANRTADITIDQETLFGQSGWWWLRLWMLRSPGFWPDSVTVVDDDGRINIEGVGVDWPGLGVRPALWLYLETNQPTRPAITITTRTLAQGAVGAAYSQTLSAVGAIPVTWSVSAGALPPGLNLNANTGAITGTPTTAGAFNFTIRAQNPGGYTTQPFSIVVTTALAPPLPPVSNPHSPVLSDELARAAYLGLIPRSMQREDMDFRLPIRRSEFAGIVVNVYQQLANTTALPAVTDRFTDTRDSYVLRAYNAGLMVGVSATEFDPGAMLTREQAATALTRSFKRSTIPGWTFATDSVGLLTFDWPARFADDASISYWANESVYFMVANGIIHGAGNNMFSPRAITTAQQAIGYANATREQALVIALRMVENLG